MVETEAFFDYLIKKDITSFFGVPDSLLKNICAHITKFSPKEKHIITANEGNAVALASGHYLATGKPALVYLQNSGLGNIINPLVSLVDEEVYKIPILFLIGWRGEPGKKDEPQHEKQGKITIPLLNALGMKTFVLESDYQKIIDEAIDFMDETSKPVAILVRKNTFSDVELVKNPIKYQLSREETLEILLNLIDKESVIVSTTGKTSRELFELREKLEIDNKKHNRDFLTVGSMGHASSIALGISLNSKKRIYCLDGDGAMLMHLGALGIAGQISPKNFKYIVLNNGAHESVGGQPTIGYSINFKDILRGLGFNDVYETQTKEEIINSFEEFNKKDKSALVIYIKEGSRKDLGRPTISPEQNKKELMDFLKD